MSSSKVSSGHLPQLDGLRGIALLLVMFSHSGYFLQAGPLTALGRFGWIGVDLFFVLSGFLITGILLDTRERPRYFLNFYARRALRIWPLYYAVIAFTYLALPRLGGDRLGLRLDFPWWIYGFYMVNLLSDWGVTILGGLWSLAIEEQFYLVWPVVAALLNRNRLRFVLYGVLIASPLLRLALLHQGTLRLEAFAGGIEWKLLYTSTLNRLDGLAVGALIAVLSRSSPEKVGKAGLLFVSLAPLAALELWIRPGNGSQSVVSFSLLAFTFAGVLCLALVGGSSSPLVRMLKNPFLRYTGKISYCLYLTHEISFYLVGEHRLGRWTKAHAGQWGEFALNWLVVYGVATLSWYLFESPLLRLKKFFSAEARRADPSSVLAAAAGRQ